MHHSVISKQGFIMRIDKPQPIDVDPSQIRSPHTVSRHHTVQPGREISRLTVQPGREGPSERRERKGDVLPWSGNIRYPPPIVMVALQPPVSLDVDI